MAKYMLSAGMSPDEDRPEMTPEQMAESFAEIQQLEADLRSKGQFLFSARLHDPDTATVIRSRNGEVVSTDGPFIEAKEHLGGFYLIDVEDLDAATAIAARVAACTGAAIEVRPMWDESGA